MVALKQKKDRMDMKVGSKLFNLGFIQKQLAKQLEPLQEEKDNKLEDKPTKTDETIDIFSQENEDKNKTELEPSLADLDEEQNNKEKDSQSETEIL